MKRSRDEASKVLGERMLQGWTMLGVSCPVEECYTPLVCNRQSNKMFCVRCNQYVLTEDELKQQQAEQKNAEEVAAIEKDQAETEARVEKERRRYVEQQFRLEEQAKQAGRMQELDHASEEAGCGIAPRGAAKRKIDMTAVQSSSDSDADVNAVRRQTLAALYQKMEALTNSLSPTDHSERLVSVARAVREIAEATQLLKQ
uniref:Sjoegren syndrome/scleroderma autoantigen 1 n=1 Tax=Peronospora matthiolae TaxID=2874970 RepID=A0AAV1T0T5_9STRA